MVSCSETTQGHKKNKMMKRMLALGLLFACVGLLFGLRVLAIATLPHILTPDAGINYQGLSDGLPAPHLLDWDLSRIEMLASLAGLEGGFLLLIQAALLGGLTIAAAKRLNPTFQLFQIVHPSEPSAGPGGNRESGAGLASSIEARGLAKTGLILLCVGLPLLLFWLLLKVPNEGAISPGAYFGVWPLVWAPRMILLGIALWVGFHPDGLGGDFATPALDRPSHGLSRLIPVAVQGAIWGLLVFMIGRFVTPTSLEPLLTRFQALGNFDTALFSEVAWRYLVCMACGWFAAGALLVWIGTRHSVSTAPLPPLLLPALSLGVGMLCTRAFTRQALAARFDLTAGVLKAIPTTYRKDHENSGVPDGVAAAAELARHIGLTFGTRPEQPDRPLLIFDQNGQTINLLQHGYSADGLSATPLSVERTRAYLSRYKYRSGLSWIATKHLFDTATLHFDTTAALDALLDDQSYSPHAGRTLQPTSDLFFVIAATPQHISLLDKWADSTRFAHPDRMSVRLIGDLYRRFGVVDKALAWYRKANMPRSFMAKIRAERPLFHQGHVTGVIRLNGQPIFGAEVGVIPWLMNGLPHRLEGPVMSAAEEISSARQQTRLFGPFEPMPYAFRWISASALTDSWGAFTLDGLTEGKYRLIVSLPTEVRLTPPLDPHLRVTNPPVPFSVHYGNPQVDLGVTDLSLSR